MGLMLYLGARATRDPSYLIRGEEIKEGGGGSEVRQLGREGWGLVGGGMRVRFCAGDLCVPLRASWCQCIHSLALTGPLVCTEDRRTVPLFITATPTHPPTSLPPSVPHPTPATPTGYAQPVYIATIHASSQMGAGIAQWLERRTRD